jgi:hypothetical protein
VKVIIVLDRYSFGGHELGKRTRRRNDRTESRQRFQGVLLKREEENGAIIRR